MHRPVTKCLRHARGFSKVVTVVVLAAFVSLTLQPLALAAQLPSRPVAKAAATTATDPTAQLAQTLEATEAKLGELIEDFTAGRDAGARLQELIALHQKLKTLDQTALQSFAEVETHLKAKALPPVILDRHSDAVKSYTQDFQTLTNALTALEAAPDSPGKKQHAEKAFTHLKEKQKKRAHTPVDPNNLPFRTPDGKVRPPHETPQAFRASLFKLEPIQLAATELTAGMLAAETLAIAAVAAAPTPADLAPTEDVQITPEIQALAASLNNNPVKIHNWVHNNIRFLPTYGSIQGSQMTLESKQGNAFDTASLLIALLRASGIHSRYVYGTIQVPVDKVMNWVGGVTVPEAAQQLLGQGGIPNTGLTQGGKITHIKMEHVWVEAWVDFEPSRGAVHKRGDTWVPMDASFKQYQYTQGMDIITNVPFDAQTLVDQIKATATINDAEGWVQNVNSAQIQTALGSYQTQIQNYINSIKPNATVGDVLGAHTIIPDNRTVLATGLPYKLIATGNRLASIPDNLRHKFTIKLFGSYIDRVTDSPSLVYTISLAALNFRRIGVTYVPAMPEDEQTLRSFRERLDIDYIAPYLVNVRPIVQLDGENVATGSPVRMGFDQYWQTSFSSPNDTRPYVHTYEVISGDEIVFGVNGNGVAPAVIQKRANVVSPDSASENLHQAALHYWMVHDVYNQYLARAHGLVAQRKPSTGLFSSPLSVRYSFSIPFRGSYQSRKMDISRLITAVSGGSQATIAQYVGLVGMVGSEMEGSIYELLFGYRLGSSNSAMHVLQAANQAGMPIYRITQSNLATVLPQLQLSPQVLTDISNAVNAGMEVVTHKSSITHYGWTGAGYIIQDPATGEGAYLISGGANGNEVIECEKVKQPKTSAIRDFILTAILAAALAALIVWGIPWIAGGLGVVGTAGGAAIKTLMASLGLTSLTFAIGANAGQNKYAYPAGSRICGGTNCGTPALYRGGTNRCPWPNMDCIRALDLPPGSTFDVNGVTWVDPAGFGVKDGISTFDRAAPPSNFINEWWKYPEEDPTEIPVGLCVVPAGDGHWAWQPKGRMELEQYKLLLRFTHPKFTPAN